MADKSDSYLDAALADMTKDINGKWGDGAALPLSDGGLSIHIPGVIPTGSAWLDWALGRGGWPLSRVVLVGGDEGTGKTTLALQAIAAVQAIGGIAVYLDAEYKLDMNYADALGVDTDRVIMSQPKYIEQAGDMIERVLKHVQNVRETAGKRIPVLIVYDSINALGSKSEHEAGMEDMQVGAAARAMGKLLRKVNERVSKESACLMLVSQLREKIGVMYGDTLSTGCGKAPLFYAATIVRLSKGKADKDGNERVGAFTHTYVHKNQVAPPHRKSELLVSYGEGIDDVHALHMACSRAKDGAGDPFALIKGGWIVPVDSSIKKWNGMKSLRSMPVKERRAIESKLRDFYGATDWDPSAK